MLLTNDGDLTFRLTHPRHRISKTYQVWVQGEPSNVALAAWRNGIDLEGQYTLPARVVEIAHQDDRTLLEIILTEGRNRQIRKVAAQLGHPVLALHRTRIGNISIDGDVAAPSQRIASGAYRHLQSVELQSLDGDRVAETSPSNGEAPTH